MAASRRTLSPLRRMGEQVRPDLEGLVYVHDLRSTPSVFDVMSTFSPCSIVTLNCNSILSHLKRLAFSQFLNTYSPPIILLQETRIITFTPHFSNYSYLHRPGLRREGEVGTAILLHHRFQYSLLDFDFSEAECTFASVWVRGTRLLIGQVSTFIHELDSVTDQFPIAVVGGDFNCRFGTKDPKMKALTSAISVYPSLSLSVPSASTFRSGSIL